MNNEVLEAMLTELREMARNNQNYEYFSGSLCSGAAEYDQGYEAGRYGAGDELEELLRRFGVREED